MIEWYRNKTWNDEISAEFEAKLKRSRGSFHKAQYLKIQAIELVETQNNDLYSVAEGLAKRVLADYPEEESEISNSLKLLGDIYRLRCALDLALDFYKQALDFEKIYPKVQTSAYLDYAELVVITSKIEAFDEVESYLLKNIPNHLFPLIKYKGYTILAIINNSKGDKGKAEHYEALANQNANETTSGLRYHQYLGVVKKRDSLLDGLLGSL
jgi:tetratricopeptide (TPR) repeat protein